MLHPKMKKQQVKVLKKNIPKSHWENKISAKIRPPFSQRHVQYVALTKCWRTYNLTMGRSEQLNGLVQPDNVSKVHTLKKAKYYWELLCISLQSWLRNFLTSSELHNKHSICLAAPYHPPMLHHPANREELLPWCPSWEGDAKRMTCLKTTYCTEISVKRVCK